MGKHFGVQREPNGPLEIGPVRMQRRKCIRAGRGANVSDQSETSSNQERKYRPSETHLPAAGDDEHAGDGRVVLGEGEANAPVGAGDDDDGKVLGGLGGHEDGGLR